MKSIGKHMSEVAWVVFLFAAPVCAQDVFDSWAGIDRSNLDRIYVLDEDGVETEGHLIAFRPDEIVLNTGNTERRIAASRVRRLERRGDPVKDGAITGAIIGLVWGALVSGFSDCPGGDSSCAASKVTGVVVFSGFSALVGAGVDALRQGRTLVYEKPGAVVEAVPTPRNDSARFAFRYAYSW